MNGEKQCKNWNSNGCFQIKMYVQILWMVNFNKKTIRIWLMDGCKPFISQSWNPAVNIYHFSLSRLHLFMRDFHLIVNFCLLRLPLECYCLPNKMKTGFAFHNFDLKHMQSSCELNAKGLRDFREIYQPSRDDCKIFRLHRGIKTPRTKNQLLNFWTELLRVIRDSKLT